MREWIEKYMAIQDCPDCKGARLKKASIAVTINKKNINELTEYTIGSLLDFSTLYLYLIEIKKFQSKLLKR